jgi:hypothetical protein
MEQPPRNRKGLIVAILLILGLTAGAGLGLLMGWVIWPVRYFDTAIADLQPEHKEQYIVLVASAYTLDGDLEKAQTRLDELEAPNIQLWIAELTDRYISEGQNEADIRALVELARALGVDSPQMAAWLRPTATPTSPPTDTPPPSPSPAPTDTPTEPPLAPTETPGLPSDTPEPQATDTPAPQPTDTPITPTDTPVPTSPPQPTNTPKPPAPTNTPKPPAAKWTWTARLVGPGEDAQGCDYGNLQIRVAAIDGSGNQIGGVWLHDRYSGQYQLTGNVGSPDFGPGETKFEYGIGGGGSLCVTSGQGAPCVSDYTRDMPCYNPPPLEDMWAAGYCECCETGITKERCQELYNAGASCMNWGHYSWRVVFKRQ